MTSDTWVSTGAFAAAAQISVQSARHALRGALAGRVWRGHDLCVRRLLGRGGRGGLVYEVAASSLPGVFAAAPFDKSDEAGDLEPHGRKSHIQDAKLLKRLDLIAPVLSEPPSSSERSEAVQLASAASGTSTRTLYRWLARYQAQGVRGLARMRPSNAGEPRVQVSRPFDKAWRAQDLDNDTLEQVSDELTKVLKGLWSSRAETAGSAEIRRLAEFHLLEICEAKGLALPPSAIRLSRRGVERFAHYRIVNQRRNDRKAFDDAKPRIRRDWTALVPMERVVADVKHLDVIVRRADGSPAWPKIVAFMDAGTGRVFIHPVLLERGEGVRQEHVIEAFLAMVAHPAWGFPQGLYLDNGSEFAALVKIDGALQLLNEAGARTIIFARPYNASAKPIESLFARLDRYVFGLLPGYAGPNRMAKKTQTVGKPPEPYPGDWEEFCGTVQDLVTSYNYRPIGGLWQDRSPADWFEQKAVEGWSPARVEESALDAAFSDPDSRRVDRGVLKIKGKCYTHPDIVALPSRTTVDLALPWRRDAPPLARVNGAWVYLRADAPYPARWIEGAREAGRRQTRQSKHVKALADDAPEVDPVALKIRAVRRLQAAQPVACLATPQLDLGAEIHNQANAIRSHRSTPPVSAAEQRRAREQALTERLERTQRGHD